jgi:8-oxo-dGTP pyrophosphatase MutT (NUDIX family)
MDFVQKVYWADKPLVLTTSREAYLKQNPEAADYLFARGATEAHFEAALKHLDQAGTRGALIEDAAPEALRGQLFRLCKPVTAGGGIVTNDANQLLLIYRRGKWDLPKGKQDEGEDIATTALREVREETGLAQLTIEPQAGETWHIYVQDGERLLKHTVWFLMRAGVTEALVPQHEEGIEEVRWVSREALGPYLAHTYAAVKEILQITGMAAPAV